MLLFHSSKDQDVIQIDHHDAFHYEVLEDVIHHSLEGGQTVGHSEEHHQGFEQASIGLEGHLPLVSRFDVDVVETPVDIQLGKVSSSTELGYEFGDQWKGVFVLDHHGIECMIVLNQSEQAILLLDEKH